MKRYTVIMSDKDSNGRREQFSYDKLSLIWYVHGSSLHTELAWRGFIKKGKRVVAETIPYFQIYKIICNDDCSEICDMTKDVMNEEMELMKQFKQYSSTKRKEMQDLIDNEVNKYKSDMSVH